jgi:DNA-binding NarL/FixJ family response regulator
MPLPIGENLGGGSLEDLSPRRRQAVELAAQGLSYKEIAKSMVPPVSASTVTHHLNKAYAVLGISGKDQLGTLFAGSGEAAMDLSALPLTDLSDREMQVFEALAAGITNGEIANLIGLTESTVRTHRSKVSNKLGISNSVQLRVAAYEYVANIEQTKEDAAITVQGAATTWLGKIADVADRRGLKVDPQMQLPVANGVDYHQLAELGFVPTSQEARPRVNLFGFLAVKAVAPSEDAKKAFLMPNTLDIAELVLENEIRVFLQNQSAAHERE